MAADPTSNIKGNSHTSKWNMSKEASWNVSQYETRGKMTQTAWQKVFNVSTLMGYKVYPIKRAKHDWGRYPTLTDYNVQDVGAKTAKEKKHNERDT